MVARATRPAVEFVAARAVANGRRRHWLRRLGWLCVDRVGHGAHNRSIAAAVIAKPAQPAQDLVDCAAHGAQMGLEYVELRGLVEVFEIGGVANLALQLDQSILH